MSCLRETPFKTDLSANEKDKTAKANNGYAITTVATLESFTYKLSSESSLKSPWQGVVKASQREFGVGLLMAVLLGLLFASVPEGVLHSCCTLITYVSRLFLPGLTVASVFYWASITVQKYFDSCTSLFAIPVFFATELCTQLALYFTGSSQTMSYFVLLSLLTFSVLLVVPLFRNEGTYTFVVLLLLANVFERMVATDTPICGRYFLINFFACLGEVFTRVTELPELVKPVEIEAKVSLATRSSLKARRSSSTSSTGSRRRTSLPALGFQVKSSIDPTTLGEAHGMLSDLLADSNLPPNVASTLKIISTMIAQPTFSSNFIRAVNPMSTLVEKRCIPDETMSTEISEQPDMRDDVQIQSRSRPHHLSSTSRRMSNLWTTTTSATGMPTVDRDGGSPNNISCNLPGSPRSGSPTPTFVNSTKHLAGRVKSLPYSTVDTRAQQNEPRIASPIARKVSSEGNVFTLDISSEKSAPEETCKLCKCRLTCSIDEDEEEEESPGDEMTFQPMSFYSKDKPTLEEVLKKAKITEHNEELDKLYDKIDAWNFPIFDVCSRGNVLRGVAYRIFKKAGFFETFSIREQVFLNYFTALEGGYNNIPYHNSVHAADVLHGVYFFTSQRIAGFCPTDTRDCMTDSDSVSGDQSDEVTECVDHYDRLSSCIPDLERFALYSAAAMHDYDHPGRTNAFLVATLTPQALLYNDRSVLENHHAAQAFSLLLSDPQYNYVESLTTADFKRFRFLVIEAVLATDLKRHFDVLQEFTTKVESGVGIDWSLESDRLLASQVCIKMADISGPSKQKDIHVRWTERIVEEFYEQGEDELSKSLPVSPYMERNSPLVAQLQETFINHLVAPLFRAYSNAGLMPGVWVTTTEYDEQEASGGESSAKDEESTEHSDSGVGNAKNYVRKKASAKKKKRRKRRKVSKEIHCEVMENIETNYQMWVRRIKEQDIEKQASCNSSAKGSKENALKEEQEDGESSEASDSSASKRETEV